MDSAASQIHHTYLVDQVNCERDIFTKASLALNIVITCHPFMDGNKRTAFQLAELILSGDDYHIQADLGEKVRALTRIAEYKCSVLHLGKEFH